MCQYYGTYDRNWGPGINDLVSETVFRNRLEAFHCLYRSLHVSISFLRGYPFNRSWAVLPLFTVDPRLDAAGCGGMPAGLGRRRGSALGSWVCDEVSIAYRLVANGKLKNSVEDHPSAAGAAPVETEHELVQVACEMICLHCALVSAKEPPLRQSGHSVDTGQEIGGLSPGGDEVLVLVASTCGWPIRLPAVCEDDGPLFDVVPEKRPQRFGGRIVEDRHPAASKALGHDALDGDAHKDLLAFGSAPREPGLIPSDVGLIDFNPSREPLATRAD